MPPATTVVLVAWTATYVLVGQRQPFIWLGALAGALVAGGAMRTTSQPAWVPESVVPVDEAAQGAPTPCRGRSSRGPPLCPDGGPVVSGLHQPDVELEAAGPHEAGHPVQAGVGAARLEAGDVGLGGLRPAGKLSLGEPGSVAGFAHQLTGPAPAHGRSIAEMLCCLRLRNRSEKR